MSEGEILQRVTPVDTTLPTGVVTFLFSDIEGSTQMLEEHRAAAGSALARHHELLRVAVEDASGAVFETVGDAVYDAFTRPTDALGAAVAIQRALAAEEWGTIGELRPGSLCTPGPSRPGASTTSELPSSSARGYSHSPTAARRSPRRRRVPSQLETSQMASS